MKAEKKPMCPDKGRMGSWQDLEARLSEDCRKNAEYRGSAPTGQRASRWVTQTVLCLLIAAYLTVAWYALKLYPSYPRDASGAKESSGAFLVAPCAFGALLALSRFGASKMHFPFAWGIAFAFLSADLARVCSQYVQGRVDCGYYATVASMTLLFLLQKRMEKA